MARNRNDNLGPSRDRSDKGGSFDRPRRSSSGMPGGSAGPSRPSRSFGSDSGSSRSTSSSRSSRPSRQADPFGSSRNPRTSRPSDFGGASGSSRSSRPGRSGRDSQGFGSSQPRPRDTFSSRDGLSSRDSFGSRDASSRSSRSSRGDRAGRDGFGSSGSGRPSSYPGSAGRDSRGARDARDARDARGSRPSRTNERGSRGTAPKSSGGGGFLSGLTGLLGPKGAAAGPSGSSRPRPDRPERSGAPADRGRGASPSGRPSGPSGFGTDRNMAGGLGRNSDRGQGGYVRSSAPGSFEPGPGRARPSRNQDRNRQGGGMPGFGVPLPQGRSRQGRPTSGPDAFAGAPIADRRAPRFDLHGLRGAGAKVARVVVAVAFAIALLGGGFAALYFSPLFEIEDVKITGTANLNAQEMTKLAGVPKGDTLLRVNVGAIKASIMKNPRVESVDVERIFPHTLEIKVFEHKIGAVAQILADGGKERELWAISTDGTWLFKIPAKNSPEAAALTPEAFDEAEKAMRIEGLPFGIRPEVGAKSTDPAVISALKVWGGLSTSLKSQVKVIKAASAESVTLTLDNGVELMFGNAEDLRDKERVALKLLQENPGRIAYINLRTPERPTWRSL